MSAGSRRSRVSAGRRDKRRSTGARPVNIGKASVVPPGLREGQVRCPACRNASTLTPNGFIRQHRDLFGVVCANRSTGTPTGIVAPPVVLPPSREPVDLPDLHAVSAQAGRSRLDAGSECRDCGKWLPGERSLCGRCSLRSAR